MLFSQGFVMISIKKYMSELKQFLDCTVGILNYDGIVIDSTDDEMIDTKDENISAVLLAGKHIVKIGTKSYKLIETQGHAPLAIFITGTDKTAENYLELISRCLAASIREDNDYHLKEVFLKNVLLENELPGDIALKAKEFDILYAAPRLVMLVKGQSVDSLTLIKTLNEIFPADESNYVLPLDENTIALLLDASEDSELDAYEELARKILAQLVTDHLISARIGIGLLADNLKDTARSYREAMLSLTVGKIFEPASYLMRYDRLGLGRLIYQLPPTLCEMFLQEVFKPGAYEALDRETLTTISKFFENSLNGSETSRQLFVHRNTLVYRLDKVQKITGLDLRNFDDAVLFKLAAMVKRYLERKDSSRYSEQDSWW